MVDSVDGGRSLVVLLVCVLLANGKPSGNSSGFHSSDASLLVTRLTQWKNELQQIEQGSKLKKEKEFQIRQLHSRILNAVEKVFPKIAAEMALHRAVLAKQGPLELSDLIKSQLDFLEEEIVSLRLSGTT